MNFLSLFVQIFLSHSVRGNVEVFFLIIILNVNSILLEKLDFTICVWKQQKWIFKINRMKDKWENILNNSVEMKLTNVFFLLIQRENLLRLNSFILTKHYKPWLPSINYQTAMGKLERTTMTVTVCYCTRCLRHAFFILLSDCNIFFFASIMIVLPFGWVKIHQIFIILMIPHHSELFLNLVSQIWVFFKCRTVDVYESFDKHQLFIEAINKYIVVHSIRAYF